MHRLHDPSKDTPENWDYNHVTANGGNFRIKVLAGGSLEAELWNPFSETYSAVDLSPATVSKWKEMIAYVDKNGGSIDEAAIASQLSDEQKQVNAAAASAYNESILKNL